MKQGFLFILFYTFLLSCNLHEAKEINGDYYDKCRSLVLTENKIGKEYFFKIIDTTIDELSIVYLGEIKTKKGAILKFINSTNFTGIYQDARRANSSIFIYDSNEHKKLGSYYVGGVKNLPNKIENGNLIFSYDNENCNQTTSIRFIDSIPKQIFVNCTTQGGDFYTFQKE
jgi:hypothetical protein